jgi:hypothetical protein
MGIFNQVIIPIPMNGGGHIESKVLLALYIILNLLFLSIWVYNFFKFKINIQKKKSMWTDNIYSYIFKDELLGYNMPTQIFLAFNGTHVIVWLVFKLSTIL